MRPVSQRGQVIVVGGHSRGVGKTALVTELVRALAPARVATVKVSRHRHGHDASVVEEFVPSAHTSTGRCLRAGAARAFLCRCPDDRLPVARQLVHELAAAGWTTVVESNRMAPLLRADLTCFVIGANTDDWKASSSLVAQVDLMVTAPQTRTLSPEARRWLARHRGAPSWLAFDHAWRVAGLGAVLVSRLGALPAPVASACA